MCVEPVMESRDLASPVFGVSVSKVSGLGLEGFRSRSQDLCLETLHKLFFKVLQERVP